MKFKDASFARWCPVEEPGIVLDTMYDVEDATLERGELVVTLVPDGLRRKRLHDQKLRLIWEHFISYQVSEETYRQDCWITAGEESWSFYVSRNSDYLRAFRENSGLFPTEAFHFLLVGTALIADVLAHDYPDVRFD